MADNDTEMGSQRARKTSPEDRLAGPRGALPGSRTSVRSSAASKPKDLRPVLLVGNLRGLAPQWVTKSVKPLLPGEHGPTVSTAEVDFRKARGFSDAVTRAIVRLGFSEANDAEIVRVNSAADFLRAIRKSGSRQTIYFGHGGGFANLFPGGLENPPVDEHQLTQAIGRTAPPPIFIACLSGEVTKVAERPAIAVVGLRTFLTLRDISLSIGSEGMRRNSLRTEDVVVEEIVLSTTGKPLAPQEPWRPHVPSVPQ